jgi:hypothetical protein
MSLEMGTLNPKLRGIKVLELDVAVSPPEPEGPAVACDDDVGAVVVGPPR